MSVSEYIQAGLKSLSSAASGSQVSIKSFTRKTSNETVVVSINAWKIVVADAAVAKIQGNVYEANANVTLAHVNKDGSVQSNSENLGFKCVELTDSVSIDRYALKVVCIPKECDLKDVIITEPPTKKCEDSYSLG